MIGCGGSSSNNDNQSGGSSSLDLPEPYADSIDLSKANGLHSPSGARNPLPSVVSVGLLGDLLLDAEDADQFSIAGLMVDDDLGNLEKAGTLSLGFQFPAEGTTFDYRERWRDPTDTDSDFDDEYATALWRAGAVRLGGVDIPAVIHQVDYDNGNS
ncbi:MAG: hypothetical protein EA402_14150 [Planctomycetota bacterium]|nr:MAG: hypothetical protein EA402_14150 [Planctomycetota bacterium]